jgi:hypothetical protein
MLMCYVKMCLVFDSLYIVHIIKLLPTFENTKAMSKLNSIPNVDLVKFDTRGQITIPLYLKTNKK